jgi:hypothetical protein
MLDRNLSAAVADNSSQQTLLHAASLISSAERLLTQAIGKSSDPATVAVLNREYARLDSLLSRLLYAQGCTEDELTTTLASLKQQAALLQPGDSSLVELAPDVVTASTIVSYVTRALNLIQSL